MGVAQGLGARPRAQATVAAARSMLRFDDAAGWPNTMTLDAKSCAKSMSAGAASLQLFWARTIFFLTTDDGGNPPTDHTFCFKARPPKLASFTGPLN